jgi:hypothetical protein
MRLAIILTALLGIWWFATVVPAEARPPRKGQIGWASWYGSFHHGKSTANGERFSMHRLTAAHRPLPLGTTASNTLVSRPCGSWCSRRPRRDRRAWPRRHSYVVAGGLSSCVYSHCAMTGLLLRAFVCGRARCHGRRIVPLPMSQVSSSGSSLCGHLSDINVRGYNGRQI